MSSLFIFLVIFLAIVCMALAIPRFNQHPLIVPTAIAIAVDLVCKIPIGEVINTVKSDFGSILVSIDVVILAGIIIGTILEKTDAAPIIASTTLRPIGKKNSALTMAITSYVTGISVFCNSGFVILSPISGVLASQDNVFLVVMAIILPGGLYATRCLVPPTPGPIAMAGTLEADLGLTILVGLLIFIPATLSALFYAKKVSDKINIPTNPEYTVDKLLQKYGRLPSALHSLSPILLLIILIVLKSASNLPSAPFGDGVVRILFSFIDNPVITLILSVFLAMILILTAEKKNTSSWITEGITNSAGILATIGAGDTLGAILQKLSVVNTLSASFLDLGVGVSLPLIIAALLKTAMGTSTVAVIITSAMIAPLIPILGFTTPLIKVLAIMAVGAGSMTIFHASNSYLRVVSQSSDMETKNVYKCQTDMAGVMDIVTVAIVFILSLVFCDVHS